MTRIEQCVRSVHQRQQMQWLVRCISGSTLFFAAIACAIAILRIPYGDQVGWQWVAIPLIAGPLLGILLASVQRRPLTEAACAIDRSAGLKDRTQTALGFMALSDANSFQKLQIADAEKHLQSLDPIHIVPKESPRTLPAAIGLSLVAVAIVALTIRPATAEAALEPNATLTNISSQLEVDLEELKKFQKENQDPELEKLLKDLEVQIESLKSPGMDPKDAMAKLSEMEAALEEMQNQAKAPAVEAQLKAIGEALSLSDAMSTAGNALSKGDLEKAAEELEKLEKPELDLKAEKAITEKLDAAAKKDEKQSATQSQAVSSAANQVSEGMKQGDRSKFKEGMKGLAKESKSQSKKKKLSDLLRKQCESLGECKSECESECNSKGNSNSNSSNKSIGKAASQNEAGDKTAKLKTGKEVKLQGQDSGQGESELQTEQAPEQEQQAVRSYREKVDQYEALNESVLNSESIPLGQRQTIRKYFESIRPTNEEINQIDQANSDSN